jgi:uncharacterized phage protein (TIGR02216 family)
MAEPFPWQQAMQFAFGQLRLSPKAFWSMTMHELNAAMAAYTAQVSPPLLRDELDQLMQQHPDRS